VRLIQEKGLENEISMEKRSVFYSQLYNKLVAKQRCMVAQQNSSAFVEQQTFIEQKF